MIPTALLVEDDREWQCLLRDELLRVGLRLDWASSRDEALRKVVEPLFPYGLVVLDPNLDESLRGLAGREIADRLVNGGGSTPPIVLVSGFASQDELLAEYASFGSAIHAVFEKHDFELMRFRQLLLDLRGVDDPGEALYQPDDVAMRAAWRRVLDSDDADARGHTLEEFAVKLLSGISLLTLVERRARTTLGEFDAAFRVASVAGTLCQEWGGHLLVECRNRAAKFDLAAVDAFAAKLRRFDARIGIIVSLAGVTGDEWRDARGAIGRLYGDERRLVLVIDRGDIAQVIDEGANLYTMLQRKDMDLRLGRL